ncbi:MAG: hypothetical protein NVSMB51_21330 [Solirubrobacteraceae bacterium]
MQAAAVAAALATLWLVLAPRTPDLAAQSYRVGLFAQRGFQLWDNGWYAGHHIPGYSLLFPALGSLIGMRVAGALVEIAAAAVFGLIAVRAFGPRARLGIIWFGLATASDLAIGRLTYALGAAVGLAALLAVQRQRLVLAGALAALCAAATPLAGLFLALAATTLLLSDRRREALAIGVPALVVSFGLALLFPEGGREPFGFPSFAGAVVMTVAFARLLPPSQRLLRTGAWLYLAATVLSFVFVTPMGGNIARLGAVFMGPLLLCVRPVDAPRRPLILLLAALFVWQWNAPATEIPKGVDEPLTHASTYTGLRAFLTAHGAQRIEVPFTRSHWEAAFLPPRFQLARGWEKQLDAGYNKLFFSRPLPPTVYHRWLRSLGVQFVALPLHSQPDPSSRDEFALLHHGAAFLRPVWHDANWSVFQLTDPLPLVTGASLAALQEDSFALRFPAPGVATVNVRYTPYWMGSPGSCTSRAPGGLTTVSATQPGLVKVTTSFRLGRGNRCAA